MENKKYVCTYRIGPIRNFFFFETIYKKNLCKKLYNYSEAYEFISYGVNFAKVSGLQWAEVRFYLKAYVS